MEVTGREQAREYFYPGLEPMDKFLGYFLPRAGSKVHVKRYTDPLSAEQYAEFEEAIRITSILRPYIIDFVGLEENFLTFNQLPSALKSQFESLSNPMIEGAIGGARRVAKLQNALTNFLCSASAFRDRSKMRIESRYGSDSSQLAAWKAAVKTAYDTHFEYRLLYYLRNYAQHHDIPLSLAPVSSKVNERSQIEATISVVLAPDKLASSPKTQKKIGPELARLSDNINLIAAATVYFGLHASFLKAVFDAYRTELAWMHTYRNALVKHLKMPTGAFPVIWEGELPMTDGEIANQHMTHFSFDELDFIFALYAYLTELIAATKLTGTSGA